MCGKTYWIHSLLQIVTCECTTARINGAKPSTIDAWQCFSSNIRDYIIKEWLVAFIFLFFSLSLSPFWLDFLNREYTFVVLFVLNGYCVVMCVKKKMLIKKKKKRNMNCTSPKDSAGPSNRWYKRSPGALRPRGCQLNFKVSSTWSGGVQTVWHRSTTRAIY